MEGKVVLLGDFGVGKSSLSLRVCQGKFPNFREVTIGAAFLQQVMRLRDGSQTKLHIWDTGGTCSSSIYSSFSHGPRAIPLHVFPSLPRRSRSHSGV